MPRHILRLEFIGADESPFLRSMRDLFGHDEAARKELSCRPWVAKVIPDGLRWHHQFLRPGWDYSESNAKGSRGVMLEFVVDEGPVYRIKEYRSWRSSRVYLATWRDGGMMELTNEEARRVCSQARNR